MLIFILSTNLSLLRIGLHPPTSKTYTTSNASTIFTTMTLAADDAFSLTLEATGFIHLT